MMIAQLYYIHNKEGGKEREGEKEGEGGGEGRRKGEEMVDCSAHLLLTFAVFCFNVLSVVFCVSLCHQCTVHVYTHYKLSTQPAPCTSHCCLGPRTYS